MMGASVRRSVLFIVLLAVSLQQGCSGAVPHSEDSVTVVGATSCLDCAENNVKSEQAFEGLKVAVKCKAANGEYEIKGAGELDNKGEFTVQFPGELLKKDCIVQLHGAKDTPCPDPSKLVSKENNKHILEAKLSFSSATCASEFFWKLPKSHPLYKYFHKKPLPKLPFHKHFFPPVHKSSDYKPPVYEPPPVYKPPVYKPPVYTHPVYKPPIEKPPIYEPPIYKPPVYKPPIEKPPIYKPPVYKPPVYEPPVYKPPVYKKPCPPIPPVYEKPLPPIPKFPPIYKKPLPPIPPLHDHSFPPIYKKPLPPFPPLHDHPFPPIYKKPLPPFPPLHDHPFFKKPWFKHPPYKKLPPTSTYHP